MSLLPVSYHEPYKVLYLPQHSDNRSLYNSIRAQMPTEVLYLQTHNLCPVSHTFPVLYSILYQLADDYNKQANVRYFAEKRKSIFRMDSLYQTIYPQWSCLLVLPHTIEPILPAHVLSPKVWRKVCLQPILQLPVSPQQIPP